MAADSIVISQRANVAWAAAVLALLAATAGRTSVRWIGGIGLTALACASDATAVVWPIGFVWSSLSGRARRSYALVILAAGAAGVAFNLLSGRPALTGYRFQSSAYALHRDLMVMMPVVLLGLAAVVRRMPISSAADREREPVWVAGWMSAGMIATLAVLVGAPLNVRLAVLPFCWQVPTGLSELTRGLRTSGPAECVVRRLFWAFVLLLLLMCWPAVHRWMQGWLLLLFLFE